MQYHDYPATKGDMWKAAERDTANAAKKKKAPKPFVGKDLSLEIF